MGGVQFQMLLRGAISGVTRVFTNSNFTGATSFAAVPIGSPAPGRVITVVTSGNVNASLTVDGLTATRQIVGGTIAIFTVVDNTANTTCTISGVSSFILAGVYAVYGAPSATPAHTVGNTTQTANIQIPDKGACIAGFNTNNGATGVTWSAGGLIRDSINGGTFISAASNEFSIGIPSDTITVTSSGGVFSLAAVSFGP